MSLIFSVDTGGTFTDIAVFDLESGAVSYAKALTTYDDLVDGVMRCVEEVGVDLGKAVLAKHGTTLVINTLLQREGARAALVTTKGFRDTLELGRGNRTSPFRIDYRRSPPLVPRELRFEIDERIHGRGENLRAPDDAEIDALAEEINALDVEAVAVSFINAYLDNSHEVMVADRLRDLLPDAYVTARTELTREWYEYERCCTAAANAVAGPRMVSYTRSLEDRLQEGGFNSTLFMMGSNGGVLSVDRTLREPVSLIESGPVGGCIGAGAYGKAMGIPNLIAFDMGGTTAKCAVIRDGQFELNSPYYVGGYASGFPIRGSVVDIVEVGAGGGSIAWVDDAGRLQVGPQSAGSDPGPVSFGRGGTEPTVTDANLIVGRIGADVFLGGDLDLDVNAAKGALTQKVAAPIGLTEDDIEVTADGILQIATITMTNAIRQITVERGYDPRDFSLFVFGGSGPIYAAGLARELGISEAIIPPEPGNFSAVGMLLADARLDSARTMILNLDDQALAQIRGAFAEMEQNAVDTIANEVPGSDVVLLRKVDMRYRGQKHTFTVPIDAVPDDVTALRTVFQSFYRDRFGHSDENAPVEIVGAQISAYARTTKPDLSGMRRPVVAEDTAQRHRNIYFGSDAGWLETPVYSRDTLSDEFEATGPVVIEEYGSTTVIGPGDRCRLGDLGEIRISVGREDG